MANINTARISTINGTIRVSGSVNSVGDGIHALGTVANRYQDVFAAQSTIGAFCESGLKTTDIGKHPEGTVVVWKNNTLVPCDKSNDPLVIGVIKHEKDEPIVLGAERILVVGKVKEGDFIITSKTVGHGKSAKWWNRRFGRVIAQALESTKENEKYSLIKAMIMKL
jgi:hypothetical protein